MAFRDESKLELSALFSALRMSKGLTQGNVADVVGIKRSAIAQFETGRASLSNDTLRQIAPILNLNPEYVIHRDIYPFVSQPDEVIKLFLPENRLTGALDYFLIYLLAGAVGNHELQFLSLSPNIIAARIAWPFDRTVYALAVRDAHNNIFLFRRRIGNLLWGSITGERDLQLRVTELARHTGTHLFFALIDIDRQIYETIHQWRDISRNDLVPLFPNPEERVELIPTIDEIMLLELLRERGMTARDAADILLRDRDNRTPRP